MRRTALLFGSLLALASPAAGQGDLAGARDRAQALGAKYGVRIVFAPAESRYETALASADPGRVNEALAELERALGHYPPRFLSAAGLREVRLAAAAYIDGTGVGGYAESCDGRFTLDVRGNVVRGFDHELFHVFDCAFFRRVGRPNDRIRMPDGTRLGQTYHDDFEWRALNPPQFDYTPSFRECHVFASSAIEHPVAGFLTWYSTCAIEEDKATLFENVMDPRSRPRVLEIAKRDRIIAAKLRLLFSRLRAFGLDLPFATG